ncbi:MAG: FAD-dependent oxidoreductase [Ignavibacterium sp.]|nr:MAG: FAD-dependent oxidoreductase [Ignavibacterium sp.]
MTINILILGAGFGGLQAATRLKEELNDSVDITLIDKNDSFLIGFTKFDVMFGRRSSEEVKSYYKDLGIEGVNFVQDTIVDIDTDNKIVKTISADFSYDYLIVALGADLAPEAIPGFVEDGYEFYSLRGAEKINPVINDFESGNLLISIFSKPYKCPPAPYEAAFQLHDLFVKKGIRDNINMKMLIPGPIPLPIAKNVSAEIEKLLKERNIELLKKHKVVELNPVKKEAMIENNDSVSYDLFIGIPVHKSPKVIQDSALGNNGWVSVSKDNLETNFEKVYAIGDVTSIPVGDLAVPKAGALAEDAANVVANDIVNKIQKGEKNYSYEATGSCYLEFGSGEVSKINTNFLGGTEPQITLEGPSIDFRNDKENFEKERIKKWFK